MKVKVSKKVHYFKYAELEINVPDNISANDLDLWLCENDYMYDHYLDNSINQSELEIDETCEEVYRYECDELSIGGHL